MARADSVYAHPIAEDLMRKAKMRRTYVAQMAVKTRRKEWEEEQECLKYTIQFLRGEIAPRSGGPKSGAA
jgi:hypothetical protein